MKSRNKVDSFILVMAFATACLWAAEQITADNYEEIKARYDGEWQYPQDSLASNVYAHVRGIFTNDLHSPFEYFMGVRGGRIVIDMSTNDFPKFTALCGIVSNSCAQIAADWHTYETNEMVRFTTLCAVTYSGFDNYAGFMDSVVSGYEACTNSCNLDTMRFLMYPSASENEYLMQMNYDNPGVSNTVVRMRALAASLGATNEVRACDRFLSGQAKQDCLDMP